ncbi:hypothetical protein LINPERPRIM_LOCUS4759 [Linum perenne]
MSPPGQFFYDDGGYSPKKHRSGGFWSFLYHSASSNSKSNSNNNVPSLPAATSSFSSSPSANMPSLKKERCLGGSNLSMRIEMVVVEEEKEGEEDQATADSVSNSSFERKVLRSRSIGCGCGSKSFSGDLFEKLSTGFGDCKLRRVESQREGGKLRVSGIKERVKCGGIFGGFIKTLSSSSSSSAYWVSEEMNGKSATTATHGRTRSWTWAFRRWRHPGGGGISAATWHPAVGSEGGGGWGEGEEEKEEGGRRKEKEGRIIFGLVVGWVFGI